MNPLFALTLCFAAAAVADPQVVLPNGQLSGSPPILPYIVNEGPQVGPLTPAFGDLVLTPRGYASLELEGFSEDLDQDGFVDPVAAAGLSVVAPHPAPIHHLPAPLHHGPAPLHHVPAPLHHVPAPLHHVPAPLHHVPAPLHHGPAPLHHGPAPLHPIHAPLVAAPPHPVVQ
eukprot:maker-scaffold275_size226830-snap-gene-1.21 protein:Tk00635 transcript:maker-scaffold275_size226830-snap-gene-1.21-mRNA-1 annotation:"ribosome binding protein 1 homolog 180kda"